MIQFRDRSHATVLCVRIGTREVWEVGLHEQSVALTNSFLGKNLRGRAPEPVSSCTVCDNQCLNQSLLVEANFRNRKPRERNLLGGQDSRVGDYASVVRRLTFSFSESDTASNNPVAGKHETID